MQPIVPLSGRSSRARVRKACQRCKVKKTKCDGTYPCQKCKDADEVCFFNSIRRMESRPKPRGYTEMLEEQQRRLSSGLRRMYRRLKDAQLWEGPELMETEGHPNVLDILVQLNRVDPPTDDECEMSPASEPRAAIREDDMPTGGSDESSDQPAAELVEHRAFSPSSLMDPSPDMFNMIDWGMTNTYTPLATEIGPLELGIAETPPITLLSNVGLRNYSIQLMEAQARQAGRSLSTQNPTTMVVETG